ncbi:MAG: chorismate-binding protein [Sphingobacteriaceae bacterium]|nr:chorismate-binding protein [Cytophagaceae bacterium]
MISVETRQLTIEAAWLAAQTGGHPAALWRLPKAKEKQLLIDLSDQDRRGKLDLEEASPGFALGPFLNPDGQQTRTLRADLYFRFDSGSELLEEQTSPSADRRWVLEFEDSLRKEVLPFPPLSSVRFNQQWPTAYATEPPQEEADDNTRFSESVRLAVEAIEAGQFKKVVLSRTKQVVLPANFSVVAAFNRLCDSYPNAFVSAVSLPDEAAVWLGATPETLVSVDAAGLFRTVSLAGTQSAYDANGDLLRPVDARWSHKEIEEQAHVSRYIIECFKKIRLREYVENGPKTVQAGNLMHLRTDYVVDAQAVGFPQLGTIMLDLLHPTSAVCGTPKAPAMKFIQAHEGYDREWYSGFLGPVNIGGESHLFVNLRTMKVTTNVVATDFSPSTTGPTTSQPGNGLTSVATTFATLYAGAGITEDSVPEKEFQETELKCQTLLSVIGGGANH